MPPDFSERSILAAASVVTPLHFNAWVDALASFQDNKGESYKKY